MLVVLRGEPYWFCGAACASMTRSSERFPKRQTFAEFLYQPLPVRAPVDQQMVSRRRLDEDRVTLANVRSPADNPH